jgi:hypothetical protein
MTYLIIQCGSKARGDQNSKSDIDYVCIHEVLCGSIKKIKLKYPNISFLSTETVHRMKQKGSLFLTHIDTDGLKVEGDENYLSLIRGYRPQKSNLSHTLKNSKEFLCELNWFPNSEYGKLWLFDVLFVALRNIVYCTNALNSIYKFGFLDSLVAFGLNKHNIKLMLKIREGKYNFRMGDTEDNFFNFVNLSQVLSVVSIISSSEIKCAPGGKTNWQRQWKYDYWDERLIERAMINCEIKDDGFRDKLTDHNYFKRSLASSVKEIVKRNP